MIGHFDTAFVDDFEYFLNQLESDDRLTPYHHSILMALWIQYKSNHFIIPFPITRKKTLLFSRVNSIATYHKCMKDLEYFGFIVYLPSYNPKLGSQIFWSYNPRIWEPSIY